MFIVLDESVLTYSLNKIVQATNNITARAIFVKYSGMKKLRRGELWTKGYFVAIVGKHGIEAMLSKYIKNQGVSKDCKRLH